MVSRSQEFLDVFGAVTYDKLLMLAADESSPDETIELMIRGGDGLVHAALVHNRKLTVGQIERLGEAGGPAIRKALIGHPNCPAMLGVFFAALNDGPE